MKSNLFISFRIDLYNFQLHLNFFFICSYQVFAKKSENSHCMILSNFKLSICCHFLAHICWSNIHSGISIFIMLMLQKWLASSFLFKPWPSWAWFWLLFGTCSAMKFQKITKNVKKRTFQNLLRAKLLVTSMRIFIRTAKVNIIPI